MAACITHDVDVLSRGKLPRGIAVRDVRAAIGSAAKGKLQEASTRFSSIARTAAGPDPYWTFDRIAATEREHGYRSTYFVMSGRLHPEDARYDPAEPSVRHLMRSLEDSGCEVGLHGSFGPYSDPAAVKAQKARLENALGVSVTGHRNHVLRFRVPDSWRAQQQAGFSYDATLGYADHEGYRGSHAFPFHPYDVTADRRFELIEIPLALMDVTVHKYRGLRGEAARAAIEVVLKQTLAVGGLATLLWHNDTFFEPDYPGCGHLFEEALRWLDEHDAWVATCAEVDRWWRAREAVEIEPLPDNSGWEVRADADIQGLTLRVTPPDGGPDRSETLDHLHAGASTTVRA